MHLMQEFGIDPTQMKTFVVIADGRAYVRSDAAIVVSRFLQGTWKLLGLVKIIPRPIRDCAYDVVARNRYRWFGRLDTCIVPTPELKARFITEYKTQPNSRSVTDAFRAAQPGR